MRLDGSGDAKLAPVDGRAVVVFARVPERGRVKSRLAATLGEDAALAIYRELGARVMEGITPFTAGEIVIACAPDDGADIVRGWLGDGWRVEGQGDGDLGTKMARAIDRRLAEGAGRVVVIGTDCPEVNAATLDTAFDKLDDVAAVIGPARDGGYYLIGVRRSMPELFADVPWSSDATLSTTLQRAASAGISVTLLRELRDIDTADDWEAWLEAGSAR